MLQGHQSWAFQNRPVITGVATVVGPEEGRDHWVMISILFTGI